MAALVCAAKRQWKTDQVTFPVPKKLLGCGWVISNKILQTDLYRKEIFLRAGISPIFKPKIGKIRCHDEFNFFLHLILKSKPFDKRFPFQNVIAGLPPCVVMCIHWIRIRYTVMLGGVGRLRGGGRWEEERCGNVPVKNNANRFLFQTAIYRLYIYLYPIPRVRSSSPPQPEKRVIIIYTSQNVKPLPRAVNSPVSPHYEGLVEYWRPYDCRMRTTMSKRFDSKFFRVNCQKIDTPECFTVPFSLRKVNNDIFTEGG